MKFYAHWAVIVFSALAALFWFASAFVTPKKLVDYASPATENAQSFRRIRDLYSAGRRQACANAIAAVFAALAAVASIVETLSSY